MISPGEARHGRPPARSSRARARARRSGKLVAEQLGSAAAVAPPAPRPPAEDEWWDAVPSPSHDVAVAGPSFEPVDYAMTSAGPAMTSVQGGGTATATLERPPADETPPHGKTRSPTRNVVEWVVIIGAALLAAVGIKTYLIQAFYIPSASMEHTLNIQDRVLVNKLSYRLHDIHRGDIVVFERPPNDVGQIRDLIKRVVGLPGETVEGHDGAVFVDGRQLREPYLEQGVTTTDFAPKRIPEGYVWVMGDNRGNSSDSRVFGAVEESSIIGRAFVRVWPLTAIGLL
ncbi:MAG: signal peptidase I [Acidimicrobiales bacterium]